MNKSEDYLRQFFIILFAHKRFMLWVGTAFTLAAVAVAYLFPPVYEVSGLILVKSKKIELPPEHPGERANSRSVLPPSREDVLSEIRIVRSRELINRTAQDLIAKNAIPDEEQNDSAFKVWIKSHAKQALVGLGLLQDLNLSPTEKLVRSIEEDLEAIVVPGSNVIELRLMSADPKVGATIINTVMEQYLRYRLMIFSSQSSEEVFAGHYDRYMAQIQALEQQKVNLLRQHSITVSDSTGENQTLMINAIVAELQVLEDDMYRQERTLEFLGGLAARYNAQGNGNMEPISYSFSNPELNAFNQNLNELLFSYTQAMKNYKRSSPVVLQLQKQIVETRRNILVLINNDIATRQNDLATQRTLVQRKREQLEELRTSNIELAATKMELDRIEEAIRLYRQNLETFFTAREDSKIEKESELARMANVQVFNWATPPDRPAFPNKMLVIPLGVITGLVLAFSLACIREIFDHTFKTPEQVERYLGLPVIGSIPENKRLAREV
ncbi:hypothetical protein PCS_01428 [Desulfocurvibacter africanus PCS]|uniref:Polysaccharide chain length determinant N-terminal domain-containing protein n=1 Tax=Desulfocurvibacter africanus PCS TaxID=1262666 RepID=M5Q2X4_DESAF|nr:Wzz/FepE/Etk N-terminal domain-containing protein [Desulfocurvibacter africanus]EMG37778.1 hypothetical protein PCS_01428 [Desulfocurvibacter africanus PCS]